MTKFYSIVMIVAVGNLIGDDIGTRDPKAILKTAQRLETARIMEAGVPSLVGASFVKLFGSRDAERDFEELAKTAETSAARAYAIIGLYELKRERALVLLHALRSDFQIKVMWYGLKYEWNRDEFEQQVKERRFFEALMHVSSSST